MPSAAHFDWSCPDWVHPFGRSVWPEIVEEIDRRGRRLLVQPTQIAMFCQLLAQFRMASLEINETNAVTHEDVHETYVTKKSHPALKGQADARASLRELMRDLGLNDSPSPDAATELDGLSRWLDRAVAGLSDVARN